MSKIEKALGRARRENGLTVVTPPAEAHADESREMIRTPQIDRNDLVSVESPTISGGKIAHMREQEILGQGELADRRIIYHDMSEDETVQAFRELRTRILQKTNDQNATIMITSVKGGSGNTFVALNLGVAFAFDTARTALVIDCNLKKPWVQGLLKDRSPAGLTDYLKSSDMDLAEIIHPVGIERLRVVPVGRESGISSEYFTSQKVKRFFNSVRHRYTERFIILDSPPMSESADAQILAEHCDYILLVVPYGMATYPEIDECIKSIDSKKFLGVVFDDEPRVPKFDLRDAVRQSFRRPLDLFARTHARVSQWLGAIKRKK